MKKIYLLFTALYLSVCASGQITVTNSTFPIPGDTLQTSLVNAPGSLSPGQPGPDQVWDLRGLGGGAGREIIYLDPADGDHGSDYPASTAMTRLGNSVESHFRATSDGFFNLGIAGGDLIGLGFISTLKFSPPYLLRRSPMTYDPNTTHTERSSFQYRFSLDDLSSAILDSLGNLTFLVDSLRIVVRLERTDRVDAWGRMQLPGGTYNVLRERRREISRTSLEAKFLVVGWTDVTDQIPAALPQLGEDTLLTYQFFSNTEKEPIAIMTVNPLTDEVQTIEYKSSGQTSSLSIQPLSKPRIQINPNPARETVRLSCDNCGSGTFRLTLFSDNGKVIREEFRNEAGKDGWLLSLDDLTPGTFFVAIRNEQGLMVACEPLLIK